MDSAKARKMIEAWYSTVNSKDFAKMAKVMGETADPDLVIEYPQSGERFRGLANNLATFENYPGLPNATLKAVHGAEDKWVMTPSFTPLRITGTGDRYVIEGTIRYSSDDTWHFVDIIELRNDKVQKVTEYFAAPFPPAEWRAKYAEKTETPTC